MPHPWPKVSDPALLRFNRLRLGILLLGVLVIAAFGGSSAYDAWRSYRYSINAAEREIGNVANALAEQTAWTLQAVDLLLLDTAQWYRSDGHGMPAERLTPNWRFAPQACPRCARCRSSTRTATSAFDRAAFPSPTEMSRTDPTSSLSATAPRRACS